MVRLIQFLQILILVVIGFFFIKDFFSHGIMVFFQLWAVISIVLVLLLELALFVIIKLVEDD
jgi:hypothetical protein